jgi:hypothetical protein
MANSQVIMVKHQDYIQGRKAQILKRPNCQGSNSDQQSGNNNNNFKSGNNNYNGKKYL